MNEADVDKFLCSIGFTNTIAVGDEELGIRVTTCARCGAMVLVNADAMTGQSPVDIHREWHAHLGAL